MILSELLQRLSQFDTNLDVIIRGENIISDISDIYEDFNHTDESRFISIDLENDVEQGVQADAQCEHAFKYIPAAGGIWKCAKCGVRLKQISK